MNKKYFLATKNKNLHSEINKLIGQQNMIKSEKSKLIEKGEINYQSWDEFIRNLRDLEEKFNKSERELDLVTKN